MKNIYFLRHGQTTLNKSWVHQYPETTLSEKGFGQAQKAASHFKDIPIDVILASPYNRTSQTAQVIASAKGMGVEQVGLFTELRRPQELWGRSWATPKSFWIMGMLYLNAGKENWHYSDEENLEEFHARARRCLEFIADRPEQNILVVTHRGLMANLAERMRRDGMDTIAQYRRALWKNLKIPNCGYLKATWSPEGKNGDTLDGTWDLKKGVTKTS